MTKPGRNEPCWCGSGKKYKRCHLNSDEAGETSPPPRAPAVSRYPHLVLDEVGREGMRRAGRFNADLMDYIRPHIVVGARADELDALIYEFTVDGGAVPACLGYHGFPRSCCISINEVVCHGIPSDQVLVDGDIVNVDLTSIVEGWHGDQSETFLVGEVSNQRRALVQMAFDCMWAGIDAVRPGGRILDIGRAIQTLADSEGYSVVREYLGHGIGRQFHQDPGVPHFPDPVAGRFVVEPGMCFTVEPMINLGTWRTKLDKRDGWTVRTLDNKLSAQFEHTLLVTDTGVDVLTSTANGPQRGHRF